MRSSALCAAWQNIGTAATRTLCRNSSRADGLAGHRRRRRLSPVAGGGADRRGRCAVRACAGAGVRSRRRSRQIRSGRAARAGRKRPVEPSRDAMGSVLAEGMAAPDFGQGQPRAAAGRGGRPDSRRPWRRALAPHRSGVRGVRGFRISISKQPLSRALRRMGFRKLAGPRTRPTGKERARSGILRKN